MGRVYRRCTNACLVVVAVIAAGGMGVGAARAPEVGGHAQAARSAQTPADAVHRVGAASPRSRKVQEKRRPVPAAVPYTTRTVRQPLRRITPAASKTRQASPGPAVRTGYTRTAQTVIHIGKWSRVVKKGGQGLVNGCRYAVLWAGPMPSADTRGTAVLVGHNYCGFERFARLPVGATVTVTGPTSVAEYRVYGHRVINRQGGSGAGLYGGDLTLQSCLGRGTGFSYLRRIA